jgi:hypothetical protein
MCTLTAGAGVIFEMRMRDAWNQNGIGRDNSNDDDKWLLIVMANTLKNEF